MTEEPADPRNNSHRLHLRLRLECAAIVCAARHLETHPERLARFALIPVLYRALQHALLRRVGKEAEIMRASKPPWNEFADLSCGENRELFVRVVAECVVALSDTAFALTIKDVSAALNILAKAQDPIISHRGANRKIGGSRSGA